MFTHGDSKNPSTWSNIPYLLSSSLEEEGVEIVRVDISEHPTLKFYYEKYIGTLFRFFKKDYQINFRWSWFNRVITYKRIRKSVLQYQDIDYCFFFAYEYYNKFSNVKSILFNDWTFEQFIKERFEREPYWLERVFISYQDEAIKHAEFVFSLFKKKALEMSIDHDKQIFCYKNNVVNDLNQRAFSRKDLLKMKENSKSILFIGKIFYKEGAEALIDAYKILQKEDPSLQLDIIGFTSEQYGEKIDGVNFHGYLKKDNEEDNILYYDLLANAKCLINPSKKWAAYSSCIEAMFYYTPVIVTKYDEFVADFGEDIRFGSYLTSEKPEEIIKQYKALTKSHDYLQKCIDAHDHVKDYTWRAYADFFIQTVDQKFV